MASRISQSFIQATKKRPSPKGPTVGYGRALDMTKAVKINWMAIRLIIFRRHKFGGNR